jgi:hypothetical protein
MKKVRKEMLVIDGSEIERICKENLGGITLLAEVFHSRIVLTAYTGENEKITSAVQIKQ